MKYIILIFLIMTIHSSVAQTLSNPITLFDPTPYGFSHVATVPEGMSLVFVAGQGGEMDKEGTLGEDFREQVQQVLLNIKLALQPQGLSLKDVVKVTTLVVDHDLEKLGIIADEFKKAWPEANFPVNTLIPVPRLALEGMLIEIDAVAVRK